MIMVHQYIYGAIPCSVPPYLIQWITAACVRSLAATILAASKTNMSTRISLGGTGGAFIWYRDFFCQSNMTSVWPKDATNCSVCSRNFEPGELFPDGVVACVSHKMYWEYNPWMDQLVGGRSGILSLLWCKRRYLSLSIVLHCVAELYTLTRNSSINTKSTAFRWFPSRRESWHGFAWSEAALIPDLLVEFQAVR